MKNIVEISCVLTLFNETPKQISRSIESILSQSFIHFEIIIILDNPNNFSAVKIVEGYMQRDSRIIFLKNESNIGKGKSRNLGIIKSCGEYIAIMDGDDYSYKDRFQKQFDYFKGNPEVDVLFPSYRKVFQDGRTLEFVCENYSLENILLSGEGHLNGAMMMKAPIFKSNLYALRNFPEEFELFIRLIKGGFTFKNTNEVLYDYIISDKESEYRFDTNNYGNKTFLLLLCKNYSLLKNFKNYYYLVFKTFLAYILTRNRIIFTFITKIIDHLKQNKKVNSIIIEFTGLPGSGKTTILNKMKREYRYEGIEITYINPFYHDSVYLSQSTFSKLCKRLYSLGVNPIKHIYIIIFMLQFKIYDVRAFNSLSYIFYTYDVLKNKKGVIIYDEHYLHFLFWSLYINIKPLKDINDLLKYFKLYDKIIYPIHFSISHETHRDRTSKRMVNTYDSFSELKKDTHLKQNGNLSKEITKKYCKLKKIPYQEIDGESEIEKKYIQVIEKIENIIQLQYET